MGSLFTAGTVYQIRGDPSRATLPTLKRVFSAPVTQSIKPEMNKILHVSKDDDSDSILEIEPTGNDTPKVNSAAQLRPALKRTATTGKEDPSFSSDSNSPEKEEVVTAVLPDPTPVKTVEGVKVRGAGTEAANGFYKRMSTPRNGRPEYQKQDSNG